MVRSPASLDSTVGLRTGPSIEGGRCRRSGSSVRPASGRGRVVAVAMVVMVCDFGGQVISVVEMLRVIGLGGGSGERSASCPVGPLVASPCGS